MSTTIMVDVWEHAPASGDDLLLLLALADSADSESRATMPDHLIIAHKSRMNETKLSRSLDRLAKSGHIIITDTPAGTVYTISQFRKDE